MIEAKLDKATIDILLHGRAICDKAHTDRRIEKEVLKSKIGATSTSVSLESSASDIDLAVMKNSFTLIHIDLTNSLKELGFKEFIEFMQFNDEMCLLLIQEYRTPVIGCDMCKDYKEVPTCSMFWKNNNSCFDLNTVISEENAAKDMLNMYLAGNSCTDLSDGYLELVTLEGIRKVQIKDKKISQCPNMQNSYKWDVLDSELPFELGWK